MSISRVIFPVLSFMGYLWLWLLAGAEVVAQDRAWQPMPPPSAVVPTGLISPTFTVTVALTEYETYFIDDEAGRIYVGDPYTGYTQTWVLALENGQLLKRYELVGGLALDSTNDWLYIDQPETGLAVINTQTDRLQRLIQLPETFDAPAPQVELASGRVIAFRENKVYLAEPASGVVTETFSLDIHNDNGEVADIYEAKYDPSAGILYLDFIIHGCYARMVGDCSTHTIISYDLASGREITRSNRGRLEKVFEGYMYYHNFVCPGASCTGGRLLWRGGRPWLGSDGLRDPGGPLVFDPVRRRFYEITPSNLRVYEAEAMALTMLLPRPNPGAFIRYQAESGNLQFWNEGRLESWPVTNIRPATPEALIPSTTPTTSVEFLAVSSDWPADPFLVAGWTDPAKPKPETEITFWDQTRYECGFPNLVHFSQDGGQSWSRPRGGLAGSCGLGTPLAISPNYSRDKTLLAGIAGLGIFKSTDGGRLWLPSNRGLSYMTMDQLLLSPTFAEDQTAFTRGNYDRDLYRSRDGGQSWQILPVPGPGREGYWWSLALSPEFDQDQTLLGLFFDYEQGTGLYRSQSGGDYWNRVASLPEGVLWDWVSTAPLFAQWQTLFAAGQQQDHGVLYRSTDGGRQWQLVLETGPEVARQLVYAANIEENRPIFLLASEVLYISTNGGSTWQKLELPAEISPTALAISPTFAQDRLLFLGTADGQVLNWAVPE
jgi:photosystem II stability/assembly factor-like uncharacterized protein